MESFIDFNIHNRVFLGKTFEHFIDFACQDWIQTANKNIIEKGVFYVALSGGKTPLKIFEKLIERQSELIDSSKIFLFWGDERCVPPTSSESNYGQAMQILNKLAIPQEHIFRIETEYADCDKKYEKTILSIVPDASFDMIMLGMGADGHTLSLFSLTPGLLNTKQLVIKNPVPQLNTTRITFTSLMLDKAKRSVVYVQGNNKKTILQEIFFIKNRSKFYPIEKATSKCCPLFWILSSDVYDQQDFQQFQKNPMA